MLFYVNYTFHAHSSITIILLYNFIVLVSDKFVNNRQGTLVRHCRTLHLLFCKFYSGLLLWRRYELGVYILCSIIIKLKLALRYNAAVSPPLYVKQMLAHTSAKVLLKYLPYAPGSLKIIVYYEAR